MIKLRKNLGFHIPYEVMFSKALNSNNKLIYAILERIMHDSKKDYVDNLNSELSHLIGFHEKTISRAITSLEVEKLIFTCYEMTKSGSIRRIYFKKEKLEKARKEKTIYLMDKSKKKVAAILREHKKREMKGLKKAQKPKYHWPESIEEIKIFFNEKLSLANIHLRDEELILMADKFKTHYYDEETGAYKYDDGKFLTKWKSNALTWVGNYVKNYTRNIQPIKKDPKEIIEKNKEAYEILKEFSSFGDFIEILELCGQNKKVKKIYEDAKTHGWDLLNTWNVIKEDLYAA